MFSRSFAAVAVAAFALPAFGQQFAASSELFGYDGTVTRYASLSDAQNNVNGTTYNFAQRDGSTFAVANEPSYYANAVDFLTNWYYSTDGNSDGNGNPNNTDQSFVQLYNDPTQAADPTLTVSSWDGSYSGDFQTFTMDILGSNATYDNSFSRLWNAGSADEGGEATSGTWLNYDLHFVATGLNGITDGMGGIVNTTNASGYSGGFTGLFQNLSVNHPDSNGFYAVNLSFNNTSWAAANGDTGPDYFDAPSTPEPCSMVAAPLGLLALWKRRKSKASI